MILRVPSFVLTAWLAAALACAPAAFAAEEADSIGGAFGDEAQATADPFPPEALQAAASGDCPALLDHRVPDIRGRTINLCAFSGKVLLVVNTASR